MDSTPPPPAAASSLRDQLHGYRDAWPGEAAVVDQFEHLLADIREPFARSRLEGHFTASSWLVDRAGTRILLTHHRKLGRWLQLGGHADGDRDLAQVALREAQEESGLPDLRVEPDLFDLDRHWIPERGAVPGHWHYDARYVVRAGAEERFQVSAESIDLAWRSIVELAEAPGTDASLRRMALKWLGRLPR